MKIIIAISGGGIRGIIPAMVLEELEKRSGRRIADCADLIAGTSTGGIIACLLAAPNADGAAKYTASAVVRLYKKFGKTVFKRSLPRMAATLGGLVGTKYSTKPLEALLHEYFGDTELSRAKAGLLIPSYQITGSPSPYFFKKRYATAPQCLCDNPRLWECARATSAANGYFKPYRIGSENTFLDGGVFANNPAMCALAEAKKIYGSAEPFTVISLGTGEDLIGYSYRSIKNWGMLQWALPFFKQTSISADATVDYMLRTLCTRDDNYFRLQASLDKGSLKMDDVSDKNLAALERAAKEVILQNSAELDKIAAILRAHHTK